MLIIVLSAAAGITYLFFTGKEQGSEPRKLSNGNYEYSIPGSIIECTEEIPGKWYESMGGWGVNMYFHPNEESDVDKHCMYTGIE